MDNRYRSVRIADGKGRGEPMGSGASGVVRSIIGLVVALAAMVILLAALKPYLLMQIRDAVLEML